VRARPWEGGAGDVVGAGRGAASGSRDLGDCSTVLQSAALN
jgi:hypothetical protein